MGFLDNLESSLKSLESQNERDGSEARRREEDQARVSSVGPWAQALKESEYTRKLFDQAAILGHRLRTKIYIAWLDTTLRLDAKGQRLELRPTANGIVADMFRDTTTTQVAEEHPVSLESDPTELLEKWLATPISD